MTLSIHPSIIILSVSWVKEDLLGDDGKGLPSSYDPHRHQNVAMYDPTRVPGCLVIEVTDSGPGLSGEQLEQIFGRGVIFNASELRAGQGSGLGLYITAGVVKLHNGSISVSSPGLGEGTTFKVMFPLVRIKHNDTTTAAATTHGRRRLPSKKSFLHRGGGGGGSFSNHNNYQGNNNNNNTSISSLGSIGSIDSSIGGNNLSYPPYRQSFFTIAATGAGSAGASSSQHHHHMKKKLSMQSIGEDSELVDVDDIFLDKDKDKDNLSSSSSCSYDVNRSTLSGSPRPSSVVTFADPHCSVIVPTIPIIPSEVWRGLGKSKSMIIKGGASNELHQQQEKDDDRQLQQPQLLHSHSLHNMVADNYTSSSKGTTAASTAHITHLFHPSQLYTHPHTHIH